MPALRAPVVPARFVPDRCPLPRLQLPTLRPVPPDPPPAVVPPPVMTKCQYRQFLAAGSSLPAGFLDLGCLTPATVTFTSGCVGEHLFVRSLCPLHAAEVRSWYAESGVGKV